MHGLPRPAQHSSNQSLQARWWSYGSEAFSVAPARLTQEGRITTREQLRAGVQELATALIVQGVQRSDRLGLVIPPGSAMATALPPCEVNVVPIQGPNVTGWLRSHRPRRSPEWLDHRCQWGVMVPYRS
jgi:hypothetical protein